MSASLLTVHVNLRAAFRARLLSVILATTGPLTDLSASASSYKRTTGSFIDDGFAPGDEVFASGAAKAANNGRAIVTSVTQLALGVDRTLVAEAAGAAVTIAAGLPAGRAWEGETYAPIPGQPFVEEKLLPISSTRRGLGAGGTSAHVIACNATLKYPAGRGTLPIERMAGALMSHFEPGLSLVYDGTVAVVMSAERRSLLIENWLVCPLTFSVTAYTRPAIT